MPLVDGTFGVTLGLLGMGPRAGLDTELTSQVLWVGNYSNKKILVAEWTHQAFIALSLFLLWFCMTANRSFKTLLQNVWTGLTHMVQAKMNSCHLECTKQVLTMTKIVTTVPLASGDGLSIGLLH